MKVPAPLLAVVRALGELSDKVVFVGGMVRPLLVTDPAAGGARPTDDVDLIVDLELPGYYALGNQLRARGFREVREEGAPLCRWMVDAVRVDVMPIDPGVLGFTNVWYGGAHEAALVVADGALRIRVIDAPRYCATKLESFLSRGEGDIYHHDLEDFIAVVDGRAELLGEVAHADNELRMFVAHEVSRLLSDENFVEGLVGHLDGDAASQARLPIVLARLKQLAASSASTTADSQISRARSSSRAALREPLDHVFRRSSNVRSASYDTPSSTLVVEFSSGTRYAYEAVPRTVLAGFFAAASAGRYFNRWIRDRYVTRKLG